MSGRTDVYPVNEADAPEHLRHGASAARLLSSIYGDDDVIEFDLDDDGNLLSAYVTPPTTTQED